MSLAKMSELLKLTEKCNFAIGSFSVINLETIMGTIKAAEELNTPIILQIAEPRLVYTPLCLMGPAMVRAAEDAKVPVAVHLDHGKTLESIREAIGFGFTSVMIDASCFPYEKNVEITKQAVDFAHKNQVDCEGEIGRMSTTEDGSETTGEVLTDISEAQAFVRETNVDAVAVAIGNQHGLHNMPPKLNFERLQKIHEAVKIPLVLHGGSGTTDEEFRICIKNGIRKINVASSTLQSILDEAALFFANGKADYFKYHELVIRAVCESVSRHINVFGYTNCSAYHRSMEV